VFSKNRACQLELLLRTLFQHVTTPQELSVAVLYLADSPEYEGGYTLVRNLFPTVTFCPQDNRPIHAQVLELASAEEREFFAFFVDDIVVVRPFGWNDQPFRLLRTRRDITSISLRLHPRVNECQPLGISTSIPALDNDLTWDYRVPRNRLARAAARLLGKSLPQGDWAGAMFIDAYVFRHRQFLEYFRKLPELAYITKLEGTMLDHPLPGTRVVCYPESRLLNIVMNRVDKHSVYPHGGGSVEELNQCFLRGERLDDTHLQGLDNRACHLVLEPRWRPA